jgi:hypothetical protein
MHGYQLTVNGIIGDNFIHKDGARDIAAALANNSVLAVFPSFAYYSSPASYSLQRDDMML